MLNSNNSPKNNIFENKKQISPKTENKNPNQNIHIKINSVQPLITNELQNSLLVEYEPQTKKFIFYDQHKNLKGHFTAIHVVKYLVRQINTDFLKNLDHGISFELIETYICKSTNENNIFKTELISHLQSAFMGNIEMVVKLYNDIRTFEKNNLILELERISVDPKIRNKIMEILKQFIYQILSQALKLIASISDIIKNSPDKDLIRLTLLKYSSGIIFKISNFMKDQIELRTNDFKTLQNELIRSNKLKTDIYQKIEMLNNSIQIQNQQISNIITNLDKDEIISIQSGGSDITLSNENLQIDSPNEKWIGETTTHSEKHSENKNNQLIDANIDTNSDYYDESQGSEHSENTQDIYNEKLQLLTTPINSNRIPQDLLDNI